MQKKAYVEFLAVAKGQAFSTKNSGKGGLLPVVMMVDEGYPALGLRVHACEHCGKCGHEAVKSDCPAMEQLSVMPLTPTQL